jgi:hypothetical protein
MQTNKKRYERFNFKKVFVSLLILLTFTISAFPVITDNVKGEYIDEATTLGSYIAWITLYDTSGAVIINWTSLNDDNIPNVNSDIIKVGYWSMGIYYNESDGGSSPYYLNVKAFLTFTNFTEDVTWYIFPANVDSYLSSYHDYGTYTILNYKTPDWSEQMTHGLWDLDDTLSVNATLYINDEISTGYYQSNICETVSDGGSWDEVKTSYDYLNYNRSNPTGHSVTNYKDGTTYTIKRCYAWIENKDVAINIRFNFNLQTTYGSYGTIYLLAYNTPIDDLSWHDEYYNICNFNPVPLGIIYPGDIESDGSHYVGPFLLDNPEEYGDYFLLVAICSNDADNLGVLGGDYVNGRVAGWYANTYLEDWGLAYSFEQQIINHVTYSMDVNNVIWLLIALLPALILGYFIGRPGVIVGLAIMSLILGYSQANYFWVMATTLGVCAIMLYKGGVR